MSKIIENTLEPRVARLETSLETVMREVREVASTLRGQAEHTDKQIQDLMVAVERASAPRRTDWGTFIAGVALLIAIGAAVISPVKEQQAQTKADLINAVSRIDRNRDELSSHERLKLHAVGEARVDALERESRMVADRLLQAVDAVDKKLQKEFDLANQNTITRVADLDIRLQKEFSLTDIRNNARMTKLEAWNYDENKANNEELRQWRLKAMTGEKGKTQ